MKRIAALLFLAFGLAPAQGQGKGPDDLASLVPADTLLLMEYDDLGGKQAWMRETALGRIYSERDVQTFLKPFHESLNKVIGAVAGEGPLAQFGMKPSDLEGIAVRRAGLAVIDASFDRGVDIDAVMRLQWRSGGEKALKLLAAIKDRMEASGSAFEQTEMRGYQVWSTKLGGVGIFAHADKNQLVVATKQERMNQILGALQGDRPDTLAGSERFAKLITRMDAKRRALLVYGDLPRIYSRVMKGVRAMFGGGEGEERAEFEANMQQVESAWTTMGLGGIEAFALADIPSGTGYRTEAAITVREKKGIFDLLPQHRASGRFVKMAPRDALFFAAEGTDLGQYFETMAGFLDAMDDDEEDEWEELNKTLGMDVRKEVLAHMGSQMATYASAPPGGGLIPDLAFFVTVKDEAKLEAGIDKMVARMTLVAKEMGISVVPRETLYRTGRIRFLELSKSGDPIPVSPAWAFGHDYLVVAAFPHTIKNVWVEKPSLETKPEFASLLARIPASTVSYSYFDTKKITGWIYNTLVPLLQVTQGSVNEGIGNMMAGLGVRLNWEDLPPAEVILRHLHGMIVYTAVEEDAIRMGYVSDFGMTLVAIPLAAFTAGVFVALTSGSAEAPFVQDLEEEFNRLTDRAEKPPARAMVQAERRVDSLEVEVARLRAMIEVSHGRIRSR